MLVWSWGAHYTRVRISFGCRSRFACVPVTRNRRRQHWRSVHTLDRRGGIHTRRLLLKWQAAKIREIVVLTLKTIGILRHVALYSRSPEFDHQSRLRAEAKPVCHFTVAVPPCPDVLMPAPTKRDPRAVADNTAASRRRHQFSHASLSRSTRNLIPAMKTGWCQLKVPCVLYTCTSV